jgi:hypothetical protein
MWIWCGDGRVARCGEAGWDGMGGVRLLTSAVMLCGEGGKESRVGVER